MVIPVLGKRLQEGGRQKDNLRSSIAWPDTQFCFVFQLSALDPIAIYTEIHWLPQSKA